MDHNSQDNADLQGELHHKIQQQQIMLGQQEMLRQEELIRMQQSALAEQQRGEHEQLFQLQQKALIDQQQEGALQTVQVVAVTTGQTIPTAILTTATLDFTPVTATLQPVTLNVATIEPTTATVVTSLQQPATIQVIPMATTVAMPPPPGIDMMSIGPPGVDPEPTVINIQMEHPPPPVMVQAPPSIKMEEEPPAHQRELRLPHALEQALAFKTERAKQIGVPADNPEQSAHDDLIESNVGNIGDMYEDFDDDDEEDITTNDMCKPGSEKRVDQKANKNKRKKERKKRARQQKKQQQHLAKTKDLDPKEKDKEIKEEDVEIEYIQETLGLHQLEPMYRQFARIFEAFHISEPVLTPDISKDLAAAKELGAKAQAAMLRKVPKLTDEYEEDIEEQEAKNEDKKPKMSKRKMKKLTRLSVAELKQLVNRPDVVEMHDVTARDPKLLVQLKAHRNTVPVPRHWCFKRKYLQGKRGIEKPPFDLPDFIKKTGIMEMRASLQEKEDQRTLKAKMRERARPKLGKIDIDYQKLHDAFFKWQTKPRLTIHGDLYYEGKEFETRLKEKKPGDLSQELRTALGMPVGPNCHKVPPPWLIAMQRYGPPPSYPNLKIPGLNAPIPEGCSFGYHAGGWGKPPVDETGKPLYGDVFGTSAPSQESNEVDDDVDKTAWGELESESEEESEEEDEDDGGEGEGGEGGDADQTGLVTPAEGLVTPSGIASIPAGLETPEIIELRKKKIESEMEGNETPALFQVLAEKRVERVGGAMMGSTHIYDVAATAGGGGGGAAGAKRPDTVELALDPSELDLVDTEAMAARYEQQIRHQQSQLQKEDLSDMLADHVARQKNKRKKQQSQENKQAKKYKEFKF